MNVNLNCEKNGNGQNGREQKSKNTKMKQRENIRRKKYSRTRSKWEMWTKNVFATRLNASHLLVDARLIILMVEWTKRPLRLQRPRLPAWSATSGDRVEMGCE